MKIFLKNFAEKREAAFYNSYNNKNILFFFLAEV
jgi:hypothetical protein